MDLEKVTIILLISAILAGILSFLSLYNYVYSTSSLLSQVYYDVVIYKERNNYYLASIHLYRIPPRYIFPGYNYTIRIDVSLNTSRSEVIDYRRSLIIYYGVVKPEYVKTLLFLEVNSTYIQILLSRLNRRILHNESLITIYYIPGSGGYLAVILLLPLNTYRVIDVINTIPPIIYYPYKPPREITLYQLIMNSEDRIEYKHMLKYVLLLNDKAELRIDIVAKPEISIDTLFRIIGLIILALIMMQARRK